MVAARNLPSPARIIFARALSPAERVSDSEIDPVAGVTVVDVDLGGGV